MTDFVHLHVHTIYSFGEALGSPKDYVKVAKQNKQKAIAKTDNGNVCGLYQFYEACVDEKIKPILGQEFYVAANDNLEIKDSSNSRYRKLVVLAKNQIGLKNLCYLSSIAFTKGMYYKPRIDSNVLSKHKDGLIVLSAGIDGVVGSYWTQGEEKKALQIARKYKAIFGEDFYLEALPILFQQQIDYNNFLIELRKIDNYKIVAANCVYYPNQSQAKYYPFLLMVKNNVKEVEFNSRDKQLPDSLYLMSRMEMFDAFEAQGFEDKRINTWLDNTLEVASKIEDLKFEKSFKLPSFLEFKEAKPEGENNEDSVRAPSLFDKS